MVRPALPAFETQPAEYFVVKHKLATDADWTVMGQAAAAEPSATNETRRIYRVGDATAKKIVQPTDNKGRVRVYWDDDISELAAVLGTAKPGGGWVGTEAIRPSPNIRHHFAIEKYASDAVGSALVWTEYLINCSIAEATFPVNPEENARVAEMSYEAEDFYITPEAG